MTLRISSNFDSGAIEVLSIDTPDNIRLRLRPDQGVDGAAPFCQWFHFRLHGAAGQGVRMVFENAAEASYPDGWPGYRCVASYDRRNWFRIDSTRFENGQLIVEHQPERDSIYYAYFEPYSLERHLDLDAALRVQHGHAALAFDEDGAAGHRARQREGGRHADGAGHRVRRMATLGREVARGDAVLVVAGAHDHRLGHHAGADVAQAHRLAGRAAQRFDAVEQRAVRVEFGRRLAAGEAEVGRTHDHQRHCRVDAGDLDAEDRVDAPAGGEHRAGDRAPGVEEVELDRCRGAGHAIDAGRAFVDHSAAGRLHRDVDARLRVDVVDTHPRPAGLRFHEALFDGERRHAREHVAAVGACVHALVADADLREQVVHVAARLRALRNDRHLAGERAAAAHAVHLQQVGRADGADQRLVARSIAFGQPFAQEEGAARGAGTHQDAGEGQAGHGRHGVVATHACELRSCDGLIQNEHQSPGVPPWPSPST